MRREQRAHGTATQVIRVGIPKERGQHGVDHLDDAIPVEYPYALQGASDEVMIILFVFLLRLLYALGFKSFTRQGTLLTCSRRSLGMIQCRGGGFTGIHRRGIDHHNNGLSRTGDASVSKYLTKARSPPLAWPQSKFSLGHGSHALADLTEKHDWHLQHLIEGDHGPDRALANKAWRLAKPKAHCHARRPRRTAKSPR